MKITKITADNNLADEIHAWVSKVATKNIDIEKVSAKILAKFENTSDDFRNYVMRPNKTKNGVAEVLVLK